MSVGSLGSTWPSPILNPTPETENDYQSRKRV